jgi:hypothetical protein
MDKTNNYELINNTPTSRLNRKNNGYVNKEKCYLKYTQGLSVENLYSDYNNGIKRKYRINNIYKSQKRKIEFLPNIYQNKYKNSNNKRYNAQATNKRKY